MRMPDGYINILHSNPKGTEVTVEQRELVMCKHCKHYVDTDLCDVFWDVRLDDFFCSMGERKDGKDGDGNG